MKNLVPVTSPVTWRGLSKVWQNKDDTQFRREIFVFIGKPALNRRGVAGPGCIVGKRGIRITSSLVEIYKCVCCQSTHFMDVQYYINSVVWEVFPTKLRHFYQIKSTNLISADCIHSHEIVLWFCISLHLSQQCYIPMYGKIRLNQFKESIQNVLFTHESLWRDSQNYKRDLWKLAKTTPTPRSVGPPVNLFPLSCLPHIPGNYHEHIRPYALTSKGSQQYLWCRDPVPCCLSVVIAAG